MQHSPRTVLVRLVAIAAAVATTFTHVHACCCVVGEEYGLEHGQCEGCPCQAGLDASQSVPSDSTTGACALFGTNATGCCKGEACESCGCEPGPQPTEAVISESTVSIDDLVASNESLGLPATLHYRQESCADWQLARGDLLSAAPQPLFCVWIN